MSDPVTISVLEPGMLTTVQDAGRFGQARFGVAPGGVLDRRAFILGNRLLDNDPDDACLEITLLGPRLRFSGQAAIALTGADLGARLNGVPFPLWEPIAIETGDEISFDAAKAGAGARAYLCVAGGIDLEPVLGSRSTDLIGLFGGYKGRALRTGDELSIGLSDRDRVDLLRRRLPAIPEAPSANLTARVLLGPQLERFTKAGVATFLGCAFAVSGKSNRQGLRLGGPLIEHSRGADMVSEGIAHGAVQVPGDGQPIVLLAGRQTVGGYVKIATVIGADLDGFGQLRPGCDVRFEEVSLEEARLATASYHSRLSSLQVIEEAKGVAGVTLQSARQTRSESELIRMGGTWGPDGVVRVIEAWERSSATHFRLEVAEFGLKLELERGAQGRSEATHEQNQSPDVATSDLVQVKAPVLGVFYRRSAPDQPVLAEEGSAVSAGQVICVLEVMKTYHEVTVDVAGVLEAFAVQDGDFVEYGQVIARIRP